MKVAEIQKPKGLDELLKDYKPQKTDTEKKIELVNHVDFTELTIKYKKCLDLPDSTWQYNKPLPEDILTPEQISAFMQTTTILYKNQETYEDRTGIVISRIIQNSYDAGYNKFKLEIPACGIGRMAMRGVGYELKGEKNRPLELTIEGTVGIWCGNYAENAIFNIKGDAIGSLAAFAKNSTFNVTGKIFEVSSTSHTATVSENLVIKTPNQFALETVINSRWRYGRNLIIYIKPDGTEKIASGSPIKRIIYSLKNRKKHK